MDIKQHQLPLANSLSDSDTFTGTSGANVGDDKKFSWSLIRETLRNLFSPLPNELTAGGLITVAGNDVSISPAAYRISGHIFSADYAGTVVANSSPGMLRYVVWYGDINSQIIRLDGVEGATAQVPVLPPNTAQIGFVLVNDAGLGVPSVDLTGFLTKSEFKGFLDTAFSSFKSLIKTSNLTSNRVHTLQDKNGVLAHLSDIIGGRVAVDINNPTVNALYVEPENSGHRIYYGSPSKQITSVNYNYANAIENAPSIICRAGQVIGFGLSFAFTRNNDNLDYRSGTSVADETKSLHRFFCSDGTNSFNWNVLSSYISRNGFFTKKLHLFDLNTPPLSSTDTGTKGEIRFTSDYIFLCVATNTWVRTPLTTW